MKNDELKLKEDTKPVLPKQELSDDELKKSNGWCYFCTNYGWSF